MWASLQMVIGADHAALEDAEKVLGGVAVVAVATAELAVRVKRRAMRGELAADALVEAGIVGHEVRRAVRRW